MHVQQPPRPRALVQVIDILRDDQQFTGPFGIEPGQGDMRRIGLDLPQSRPPRIVELVNLARITDKRFWRRHILDPMSFPQPVRSAKCREPAFRADPGASQNNDVANRLSSYCRSLLPVHMNICPPPSLYQTCEVWPKLAIALESLTNMSVRLSFKS